eukprot:1149966-Pelagomonas_calceolata.AAC.3
MDVNTERLCSPVEPEASCLDSKNRSYPFPRVSLLLPTYGDDLFILSIEALSLLLMVTTCIYLSPVAESFILTINQSKNLAHNHDVCPMAPWSLLNFNQPISNSVGLNLVYN